MNDSLQQIADTLLSGERIYLFPHENPDGDAVGSLLAAGQILSAMGKRCVLACADDVPRRYRELPGAERIVPSNFWRRIPTSIWRALSPVSSNMRKKC